MGLMNWITRKTETTAYYRSVPKDNQQVAPATLTLKRYGGKLVATLKINGKNSKAKKVEASVTSHTYGLRVVLRECGIKTNNIEQHTYSTNGQGTFPCDLLMRQFNTDVFMNQNLPLEKHGDLYFTDLLPLKPQVAMRMTNNREATASLRG